LICLKERKQEEKKERKVKKKEERLKRKEQEREEKEVCSPCNASVLYLMYGLMSKLVCSASVLWAHDCTFVYWAAILDLTTGRYKSQTGSTQTASPVWINSD